MIHPHTELRLSSPEIGLGIFVTKFIPKGTFTWVLDPKDIKISPDLYNLFKGETKKEMDHFTYIDNAGMRIYCHDISRYMNHNCSPTTLPFSLHTEVAVVDLEPGMEITTDYAFLNLLKSESFHCSCGSSNCRRFVGPDDLATVTASSEKIISNVRNHVGMVEQPLLKHMVGEENFASLIQSQQAPWVLENHAVAP